MEFMKQLRNTWFRGDDKCIKKIKGLEKSIEIIFWKTYLFILHTSNIIINTVLKVNRKNINIFYKSSKRWKIYLEKYKTITKYNHIY